MWNSAFLADLTEKQVEIAENLLCDGQFLSASELEEELVQLPVTVSKPIRKILNQRLECD